MASVDLTLSPFEIF